MFSSNTSQQSEGYQIQRSLRFNSADSAYLNRTPASAGNRKTWTWSAWVKRGDLGTGRALFSAGSGDGGTIRFQSTDTIRLYDYSGSAFSFDLTTTQVFRDSSAWYHFVFAYDSTQATASNRARFYVNGVEVTSFSSSTYPSLNQDTSRFNNNQAHGIGQDPWNASNYFNGYMTEVNFIDGQALTPSSFGQTNANTGVWEPKPYAGTYGTNGFYLNFSDNSNTTATTLGKDYSRGTNLLTYSEQFDNAAWTKTRSSITANTVVAPDGTLTGDKLVEDTTASNTHFVQQGASLTANTVYTTSVYAKAAGRTGLRMQNSSISNWAAVGEAFFDLTTGTVTSGTGTITSVGNGWYRCTITGTFGGSNATGGINIFLVSTGTSTYTGDGYSGIYIWGAQLEPGSSAGAYTQTTAGTAPNNWTPNNFSVSAGAGNDSLVDVPTPWGTDTGVGGTVRGNYATLNPVLQNAYWASPNRATLTNGNLDAGGSAVAAFSTFEVPTNEKIYFEATCVNVGTFGAVQIAAASRNTFELNYLSTGQKQLTGAVNSSYGASWGTGDIIGVAIDRANNTATFYKNGVSQGAITHTFPSETVLVGAYMEASPVAFSFNFGQRPFAYPAPSGFKALCTQNLPTPTVGATAATQAGKYFNAVTYTGTQATRSVTGVGFQPDFVWIKNRSIVINHGVYDAVRGVLKDLQTNVTDAEVNLSGSLTSFDSDGFSLGSAQDPNKANDAYVAWNWKANGAGVTNTAGSITSTVSANTTSGFSVVTYTGNGINNATVGHGLGAAPKMVIIKSRSAGGSSNYNWTVYTTATGTFGYLYLNTTDQINKFGAPGQAAPTSSVFSLATGTGENQSTVTYVAYCFAEVPGYSKFGSYTGNGSTDGPFVYCGFRPAYVMIKRTNDVSSWEIHDTKRAPFNADDKNLYANLSDAEAAYVVLDELSNGFKLRTTLNGTNASGGTYIFAAFAEAPQKFALAR